MVERIVWERLAEKLGQRQFEVYMKSKISQDALGA